MGDSSLLPKALPTSTALTGGDLALQGSLEVLQ